MDKFRFPKNRHKIRLLINLQKSSAHLLEILAIFLRKCILVLVYEFVLLLLAVDPKRARTHKIGAYAALWTSSNDFVVELLRLSPLPDALEAEAVRAVRQDSKALLSAVLLPHNVETNAAGLLF